MATAETLNKANVAAANQGGGSTKTGVAPCALRACEPTSLTIQHLPDGRSTKTRGYVLNAAGKPTRGTDHVLEVLSDASTPTVLAIKFSGSCAHGKPSTSALSKDANKFVRYNTNAACPAVEVTGPGCIVVQPSPLHISVLPDTSRVDKSFLGLIKHYLVPLPSEIRPAVYVVQSKKCGGNGKLAARIEVFPRVKVSGGVSLKYKPTNQHAISSKHADKDWPLVLEGAIECEVGGQKWKLGGQTTGPKGKDDISEEFLKNGQRAIRDWLKKLSDMNRPQRRNAVDPNVKFKIEWPSITFEVNAANKELNDSFSVECETKVKLVCEPLIGAEINIDILGFLLSVNQIGSVLKRIRKVIEEGYDSENLTAKGEIKFEFTVRGEIKGGLEASKQPAQPWEPEGTLGGTIGINLVAKISLEAAAKSRWVEVQFGAGGSLELKGAEKGSKTCDVGGELKFAAEEHVSADGKEKKNELGVQGVITFNGLAIYFIVYYEVSVNIISSESAQETKKNLRKKSESSEKPGSAESKNKYEGLVVLCEPWEWPKKSSISSASKAPTTTPLHKTLA